MSNYRRCMMVTFPKSASVEVTECNYPLIARTLKLQNMYMSMELDEVTADIIPKFEAAAKKRLDKEEHEQWQFTRITSDDLLNDMTKAAEAAAEAKAKASAGAQEEE